MEAQLAGPGLNTESSAMYITELQKAWHMLSLLLALGRPARPLELAFLCTLFPASPEFVQFLCSILGSPLFLTSDQFVTFSPVAFVAFGHFVANSNVTPWFSPRLSLREVGPKRIWENVVKTYYRVRKRARSDSAPFLVTKRRIYLHNVNDEAEDRTQVTLPSSMSKSQTRMFPILDVTHPSGEAVLPFESVRQNTFMVRTSAINNSDAGFSGHKFKNSKLENEKEMDIVLNRKEIEYVCTKHCLRNFCHYEIFPQAVNNRTVERTTGYLPHLKRFLVTSFVESPFVCKEAMMNYIVSVNNVDLSASSFPEEMKCKVLPMIEAENGIEDCLEENAYSFEEKLVGEHHLIDCDNHKRDTETLPTGAAKLVWSPNDEATDNKKIKYDGVLHSPDKEKTKTNVKSGPNVVKDAVSVNVQQLTVSPCRLKNLQKDSGNSKEKTHGRTENSKAVGVLLDQQERRKDKKPILIKQKLKKKSDQSRHVKEKREISKENTSQLEQKVLPTFESFIVEEEEGSGGYGTVYRAHKKNNGATVAIKCPHANANKHHVHNELKMLERFGGRNFVIKFEGTFKCGNSDCLVLEHVEHDRPEVLKREIDIFQLQWYGYCIFRALAGLHKHGIVHRDVKPGNFLFSRKVNKGYLIDFNLAMDVNQKYGTNDKSKVTREVPFNYVPFSSSKSFPATKSRKFPAPKASEAINLEAAKESKLPFLSRNPKRKSDQVKAFTSFNNRNIVKNQCADGSGITSAKDATSTMTPSAERLREPVPCKGRKELISLVHKAMHSPNREAVNVPAVKRKRVAASPVNVDRKVVYLTPMPLQSAGISVSGAGLPNNKGDGKHKKEGPCVGTKGFRAPEVLLRSLHQGPKVDTWSAGVTLLYLMIGRAPFTGDPDQNMKEIAKLRGSEDLWEVAKLHNRESSFPVELFDIQSLPSLKLRTWCQVNTRRPGFLEVIPRSLFDLVDKCLTVNPRLRISAEEALRHEFFAPCHEALRKQRLLRRTLGLDSGSTSISQSESPVKVSHE